MIAADAKTIKLFVDDLESFTKCKNLEQRISLEHIVSYIISCSIQNFTTHEVEKVILAIHLSAKHHAGIERESGEPYIIHPLSAVYYFMVLGLCDFKLTIATILHDVVEDKTNQKERMSSKLEIIQHFGEEIKIIVKLVTKKFFTDKQEDWDNRDSHFSRLIESENWRALLLKICDRWHNLKTLHEMPVRNQKRKLEETFKYFPLICETLLTLLKSLEEEAEYEQRKMFALAKRIVFRFQDDLNSFKTE